MDRYGLVHYYHGTGAGVGAISLIGAGGDGTNDNFGIFLTDAGTEITAADADIALTGIGGGDGSTRGNNGIYLVAVQIESTGTGAGAGNITLDRLGGDGTDWNSGVNGGCRHGDHCCGWRYSHDRHGRNGTNFYNVGILLYKVPSLIHRHRRECGQYHPHGHGRHGRHGYNAAYLP